jgi:hypothetical protein
MRQGDEDTLVEGAVFAGPRWDEAALAGRLVSYSRSCEAGVVGGSAGTSMALELSADKSFHKKLLNRTGEDG